MLARALVLSLIIAPVARAQFQIDWYTIDGGGGSSAGGGFSLTGTIGQPDAAAGAGGSFQCLGGFWGAAGAAPCYANCDGNSTPPLLTVNDFVCFQSQFAAGSSLANCDGNSTPPLLTVNDFVCFQSAFAAGCP